MKNVELPKVFSDIDFEADADTEEIEDFFLLEDRSNWEEGNYYGADKP